ncbi:hypothetical protein GN958_ATG05350 [Phytophthora infestans]|uniref:Uncharacterized protein n=1 Tax=Phytophthora infestans TaxID=4787 RepID=A0A8S9V1U5_PHYIN|nr:hypothetical protein GN958_ATG05350 [Phytophthora infestans]
MNLGSDIVSDSEDAPVFTSDNEYETTSPSLSEGEEGRWNQDSDQKLSPGVAVGFTCSRVNPGGLVQEEMLRRKGDKIERFVTSFDYDFRGKENEHLDSARSRKDAGVHARRRGTGERNRFVYCLPLVGPVCRYAFCALETYVIEDWGR